MRTAQSLEEYYAAALWRNCLDVQREAVERARDAFKASNGAERQAASVSLAYELKKLSKMETQ